MDWARKTSGVAHSPAHSSFVLEANLAPCKFRPRTTDQPKIITWLFGRLDSRLAPRRGWSIPRLQNLAMDVLAGGQGVTMAPGSMTACGILSIRFISDLLSERLALGFTLGQFRAQCAMPWVDRSAPDPFWRDLGPTEVSTFGAVYICAKTVSPMPWSHAFDDTY